MVYALENEAFKYLSKFLKVNCELEVVSRFVRVVVGDEEISVWGRVGRNGEEMYLVR